MENNYHTILISNRMYVLCDAKERREYPVANFLDTEMALCGALKKGETLDHWIRRAHRK